MHPQRLVGLALMFAVLAPGRGPALAGDSAAESALKAKGLTRAGRLFVDAEAEKPALEKMKDTHAAYALYAKVAEKQAAAEQLQVQAVQLEQQRAALQANISALNQQISAQNSSMGGGRYSRAMRSMGPTPLQLEQKQETAAMNEAAAMQRVVKSQIPSSKDKATIDEEVRRKGDAFKTSLTELRTAVDEVTKKYAELNADPKVKRSLEDLEKAGHATMKIGPSEALAAGLKELDQAEHRFLGKKTAAAKKKSTSTKSATKK